MKKNGFDRLAKVYDFLARLVYGKSLFKAQTFMMDRFSTLDSILIVGGGTGWFLEEVLGKCQPRRVCYVEKSKGMMDLSQKRVLENMPTFYEKVDWHLGTLQDLEGGESFDLICTHCFLDLFDEAGLRQEMALLEGLMRPGSAWYFSDFRYAKSWPMSWISKGLIAIMYAFFRNLCQIDARRLGDFHAGFAALGLQSIEQKLFFGGMIQAHVLKAQAKPESQAAAAQ